MEFVSKGKRLRKKLLAVATGVIAASAIAAPAMAARVEAGGGIWEYGAPAAQGVNYSYYYHKSVKHRSSVSNQKHGYVGSNCVNPDVWARAVQPRDPNGNNKAFWSTDDC